MLPTLSGTTVSNSYTWLPLEKYTVMQTKKNVRLLVACLTVILSSCNDEQLCGCVNIDLTTYLVVTDDQNNNLLDPSTPGHFEKNKIRIFYVKDGERKEVYSPNLDRPRNFDISNENAAQEYAMKLFPDEGKIDNEITTTIIQWSDNDEDTVTCEVRREASSVWISKVWYDGTLAYDQISGAAASGHTQVGRWIRVSK
jgi:hypothetical protein